MRQPFERLVGMIDGRARAFAAEGGASPFALRLADGEPVVFGDGAPAATLVVRTREGLAALSTLDRSAVAEAYLADAIDVEGDLLSLLAMRNLFTDRHPLRFLYRLARPLLFGQVSSDRAAIPEHYDADSDFFLLFLDRRHRCYSQGIFEHDEEPLEDAISRKLDYAFRATGVRPGDHVLDIGGGWGAFVEYAGLRGVRVTTLTISEASERFLNDLVARLELPCRVRREHLYEHRPPEPYDAVVNLGVSEHLPEYRAVVRRYCELLKPGGRIYLDASASRIRHDESTFFEQHIFRGNGTTVCLHEYLAEVSRTPLQVEVVWNDRLNYLRTVRHWAGNLDRHREEIEARWGRAHYRRFQLYLWGCVDGFARDHIQAYRWVMAMPETGRQPPPAAPPRAASAGRG